MKNPKVSVVILNYNGRHYLEMFMPHLLKSTYSNLEIVIADNASTDDSIIFLKTNYPTVIVKKNSCNQGFAGGYNWALQGLEADYFILLNSDVEVTKQWIEPLIELMESNLKIAACQSKILSQSNKILFEYAGAAGGWIDYLGYPFSKGRIFDTCEKDNQQYNQSEPIFWASGAVLCIRSNLYFELGGFDDYFFAHQEEIDLCWRLQLKGYLIYSCPQSVVYHVGAGTLKMGQQKLFLNYRNNLLMLYKNLIISEKIWKLPIRIILDYISGVRGIRHGDFNNFLAVCKAHYSFLKAIQNKKVTISKNRQPLLKLNGVYKKMIIIEYFIRKKNYFSELFKA